LQGGPRKETCLCNVAPGTAGRRGSGEIPAGVAGVRPGEGGEEVYGSLWFGLVGRTGAERLRRAGTPAAREGGRRGCHSLARDGLGEGETGRRAVGRAEEGGGNLGGTRGRPERELAAAARLGAGGGSVWWGALVRVATRDRDSL
jgi:hypothetical protein